MKPKIYKFNIKELRLAPGSYYLDLYINAQGLIKDHIKSDHVFQGTAILKETGKDPSAEYRLCVENNKYFFSGGFRHDIASRDLLNKEALF